MMRFLAWITRRKLVIIQYGYGHEYRFVRETAEGLQYVKLGESFTFLDETRLFWRPVNFKREK